MEDNDEIIHDYTETTVPIGQVLPLCVSGITFLVLFVPVVRLSLRPPKESDENDDDESDHGNGDTASSPFRISLVEQLGGSESAPLLSMESVDNSGYGGASPGRKVSRLNRLSRSKSPSKSPSKTFRRLNSADAIQKKSASNGECYDDEVGDSNALKFSDPATSSLEKLKIVTLNNCDAQTKAMLGLGFPYLMQSLVSAVSEIIQMAVVGRQLGTNALSAYVVVDLFIKLTSDAVGYVITSGNTMISQIAEAEDTNRAKKIGSYLQLSILFYVVGMIPIILFWSRYTEVTLVFLGLEPEMAVEGQGFARAYVLTILVDGIHSAFQYTLDVLGYQVESTIMTFVGEVFTTSTIVVLMCYQTLIPDVSLTAMGWTYVFVDMCYLAAILALIYFNGWLDPYSKGFFSNPLSIFQKRTTGNGNSNSDNESGASWSAVKLMISNTIQYSISNFLFQGEWQILILFASSLGSAEVAAWGVLGVIWEELEYTVSAISEGCAVRVALTLGKGDAKTAKLITYKAIWISLVWGILVSIVFRLYEDAIPRLITNDPLLQEMVSFNLPMISLANIVSAIAVMAEHVLWCQNRARLSTIIASGTSGLITLPLAGISSCLFHFDLIGQTTAVAIGSSAFAAWAMYSIVSSDWDQISEDVMAIHADEDDDEDSDDDSDESEASE